MGHETAVPNAAASVKASPISTDSTGCPRLEPASLPGAATMGIQACDCKDHTDPVGKAAIDPTGVGAGDAAGDAAGSAGGADSNTTSKAEEEVPVGDDMASGTERSRGNREIDDTEKLLRQKGDECVCVCVCVCEWVGWKVGGCGCEGSVCKGWEVWRAIAPWNPCDMC